MAAASSDEGLRRIPAAVLDGRHECCEHWDGSPSPSTPPLPSSTFGSWVGDTAALAERFRSASPYPHVVIDDFFAAPLAAELLRSYPPPDAPLWHVYENPLECKLACNDIPSLPEPLRDTIYGLCSPAVVELMRQITGLAEDDGLQADAYCHGGGLHSHCAGGKLDLHLDYSLHPHSGLERRFNLIVYLNPEWSSDYGGALELWSATTADSSAPPRPAYCDVRVQPTFNRAVLFSTTAPSFHGFPQPLTCPAGVVRRSLALYYLTPPRTTAARRHKALYVATPGEPHNPTLERLRQLRSTRRLQREDWVEAEAAATREDGEEELQQQQVTPCEQ